MSWQVHWASVADTGNGPLRCSGYGSTPDEARDNLHKGLAATLDAWDAEATEHRKAVDEVRERLSLAGPL